MTMGRGGGGHLVSLASRDLDDGLVEVNDRHLQSHGKIGDCEQSTVRAFAASCGVLAEKCQGQLICYLRYIIWTS